MIGGDSRCKYTVCPSFIFSVFNIDGGAKIVVDEAKFRRKSDERSEEGSTRATTGVIEMFVATTWDDVGGLPRSLGAMTTSVAVDSRHGLPDGSSDAREVRLDKSDF